MREYWNYTFQFRKISKVLLNLKILLLILFLNSSDIYGQEPVKSTSLFDGKSLTGWKTVDPDNQKLWYVVDSVIISGDGIAKIPENTYLYTLSTPLRSYGIQMVVLLPSTYRTY